MQIPAIFLPQCQPGLEFWCSTIHNANCPGDVQSHAGWHGVHIVACNAGPFPSECKWDSLCRTKEASWRRVSWLPKGATTWRASSCCATEEILQRSLYMRGFPIVSTGVMLQYHPKWFTMKKRRLVKNVRSVLHHVEGTSCINGAR